MSEYRAVCPVCGSEGDEVACWECGSGKIRDRSDEAKNVDVQAWLESEVGKPERWIRNRAGAFVFTLNGVELKRIEDALSAAIGVEP